MLLNAKYKNENKYFDLKLISQAKIYCTHSFNAYEKI